MGKSHLERSFLAFWPRLCKQNGFGQFEMPRPEFQFAPPRRWRFDFAWPAFRVAVELEGGVWTRGRHVRPKGFLADVEKYNHATRLGWAVLRLTDADLSRNQQETFELIVDTLARNERK